MRRPSLLVAALAATVIAPSAHAEKPDTEGVTLTPSAEYTVRFRHFEGKDLVSGGVTNFARHRARAGLSFEYDKVVGAMFQVQDVRIWGEETDTLGDFSANGLDVHQGFVDLMPDEDIRLRIGRQEISYLNQRLIGSVNFAEQARAFDAVRLTVITLDKALVADAFYARVAHTLAADSTIADDLFALALRMQFGDFLQPALIEVVDLHSATERVRSTTGLLLQTEFPFGLKVLFEGYLQAGGARDDVSYLAWFFGTRVRFTLVDLAFAPYAEFFADIVSGDHNATDTKVHSFDSLFATNHKFYGEADFFLNLPKDTAQRGLIDVGATLGTKIGETGTASAAFHAFLPQEGRGHSDPYGMELDVLFGWKPERHIAFDLCYAGFFPGDAMGVSNAVVEHLIYTTATASF